MDRLYRQGAQPRIPRAHSAYFAKHGVATLLQECSWQTNDKLNEIRELQGARSRRLGHHFLLSDTLQNALCALEMLSIESNPLWRQGLDPRIYSYPLLSGREIHALPLWPLIVAARSAVRACQAGGRGASLQRGAEPLPFGLRGRSTSLESVTCFPRSRGRSEFFRVHRDRAGIARPGLAASSKAFRFYALRRGH